MGAGAFLAGNNPAYDANLYRYNGIYFPSLNLDEISLDFWEKFSEGAQTHWGLFTSVARPDGGYLGFNQNWLDFGAGGESAADTWLKGFLETLGISDANTNVVRSAEKATAAVTKAIQNWKVDNIIADIFLTPSGEQAYLGGEVAVLSGPVVSIATLYDLGNMYGLPSGPDQFDPFGLDFVGGAITTDQLLECARLLSGTGLLVGSPGGGFEPQNDNLLETIFDGSVIVPYPFGWGIDPDKASEVPEGVCIM
jgi:hypothetical protein